MPDFRLFHVNADGDSVDVEAFCAVSDEIALNVAVTRTGLHNGELWSWNDRRLIAAVTRNGVQTG